MTQTDLEALMNDELQQLDGLSIKARQRMRELAQELAAEFAQQLQQEMAQQTGNLASSEDMSDMISSAQGTSGGNSQDGWLAGALGSAFNQAINRIAQGKTLTSKTAITALFSQPARQLGTQWGNSFADGGVTQLRLSDSQYASDIWSGLTTSLND